MRTHDALRKAQEFGLDLVEVAPNADPPVCRIVDFGKYRYTLAKQKKESKSTQARLKEVKFRVNIDEHDYTTKLRRAEAFLDKGSKVRIQLQFRGREMAHQELGHELMNRVCEDLNTMSQVELQPRKVGRHISMVLAPLPANRRKRRFLEVEEKTEDFEEERDQPDAEPGAEAEA